MSFRSVHKTSVVPEESVPSSGWQASDVAISNLMKAVSIPLILAALISGITSAAEGNPSKQDIEAMLGKKGSCE